MHAFEVGVDEPLCVLGARQCIERDFADHGADLDLCTREYIVPIEAGDGDVLARKPGLDGVPFRVQRVHDLGRPQTQCLPRTPVVAASSLAVACETAGLDRGCGELLLRYAAGRGEQPADPARCRRRLAPDASHSLRSPMEQGE